MNFDIDISIFRDLVSDFVFVNGIFGEVLQFESHVLISWHWSIEIEILDVDGHKSCPLRWNGAVEEQFDGGHICCECVAVAGVV